MGLGDSEHPSGEGRRVAQRGSVRRIYEAGTVFALFAGLMAELVSCRIPPGNTVTTQPCGLAGETCCSGTRCANANLLCDPSGVCRACGVAGAQCCLPNEGCGIGLSCQFSQLGGRECAPCGGFDQFCCAAPNPCARADNTCGLAGICEPCGGMNELCCNGACGTGTACVANYCLPCGSRDQPCCAGSCAAGSTCSGGFCMNLFGRCSADADCGVEPMQAWCDQSYAGGLCTRDCVDDRDCGPIGVCDGGRCLPLCRSADGNCDRYGAACSPPDPSSGQSVCLPSCFGPGEPLPAPGWPSCNSGLGCDPYWGACLAMPSASTGADDGAPCSVDADCKSAACIPESDIATGASTGYLGGYCVSHGYRLPDTAYVMSAPLPQGNCPAATAPYPYAGTQPGDVTTCLATCDATRTCRSGYECDSRDPRTASSTLYFSNGVCIPIDCATSSTSCPSGTHCEIGSTDGGAPTGVCARDAPDGGVDAGTDATGIDASGG